MDRIGFDYSDADSTEKIEVYNRFGGGSCQTTPLIARCIEWVYQTSNKFEQMGYKGTRLDDFDRMRYFILEVDNNAFMTCID